MDTYKIFVCLLTTKAEPRGHNWSVLQGRSLSFCFLFVLQFLPRRLFFSHALHIFMIAVCIAWLHKNTKTKRFPLLRMKGQMLQFILITWTYLLNKMDSKSLNSQCVRRRKHWFFPVICLFKPLELCCLILFKTREHPRCYWCSSVRFAC